MAHRGGSFSVKNVGANDNNTPQINLNREKSEKDFSRNLLCICIGGFGRDTLYCLVSSYFLSYVQFGLTLTAIQYTVLALLTSILGRAWDIINIPLMGSLIDSAKLKMGKYRPWIFIGAVLDAISMLLLFHLKPASSTAFSGWIYVSFAVAIYLIWETVFTLNDVSIWSLIPSVARTKTHRDKILSRFTLVSSIGSFLMSVAVTYLSPGNLLESFTIFTIIASVISIGFQAITAFGSVEMKEVNVKKEKVTIKHVFSNLKANKELGYISLALFLYNLGTGVLGGLQYNLYYLEAGYNGGFIYVTIACFIMASLVQLFYPKCMSKWGIKKIRKFSLILILTSYLLLALAGWTKYFPLSTITYPFIYLPQSVGTAFFYLSSIIGLENTNEYGELTLGKREDAAISSARLLITMFADCAKTIFSTLVLLASGLFLISSSVSAMEAEVRYAKETLKNDPDLLEAYILDIQEYASRLAPYQIGSAQYNLEANEIDEEISAISGPTKGSPLNSSNIDEAMKMYVAIYVKGPNDLPNVYNTLSYAERVSDIIDPVTFFKEREGRRYALVFVFKGTDTSGAPYSYNVANEIYGYKKTLGTRIGLRIAATVIPAILVIMAYYIECHKFTIDEDKYEAITEELAQRKQETLEE